MAETGFSMMVFSVTAAGEVPTFRPVTTKGAVLVLLGDGALERRSMRKPSAQRAGSATGAGSVGEVEELLGLAFHLEPRHPGAACRARPG